MQRPSFDFERTLTYPVRSGVAGIDEVGRGALCGPVVAAALVFGTPAELPGLDDSKKLSPRQRDALFAEITALPGVQIGVGIVSHEIVDRVNVLQATILAMRQAVDDLPALPSYLLIDGLEIRHRSIPCKKVIRGDALCPSISAASIVAKVVRDRIMDKYDGVFPGYGFSRHKGYGTREHLDAIASRGVASLHRKTFMPCCQMSLFDAQPPAHAPATEPDLRLLP